MRPAPEIKGIVTGRWRENCYVVYDRHKDALIFDPGGESARIIEFVEAEGLRVLGVLNTHAHYDHIGAVAEIKEHFNAPFYLHSADSRILKYANLFRKIFDGEHPVTIPSVDQYIDDMSLPITIGDFVVDVLFTPGHTEGGVCFLVGDCLISGDTLFKGKVGRIDLPGGDRAALSQSLRKLSQLPAELRIFPGHGSDSSMAEELQANSELRGYLGED